MGWSDWAWVAGELGSGVSPKRTSAEECVLCVKLGREEKRIEEKRIGEERKRRAEQGTEEERREDKRRERNEEK